MPTITVKARGLKVYDPRDGSTAWSDNPALCLRDFLTNTRYGAAIPETAIDDDSFSESANYCDELVTFKNSDGVEYQAKRYTCNGVLNPDDGALENTKRILSAFRGIPVFSGGKWRLVVDKPDVADFEFTEENIIGSWSFSGSSKRSIVNQVRARFYDAALDSEDTMTVVSVGDYIEEDGQIFEQDVYYPLTNDLTRANILAQHYLKQARQGLAVSLSATLEALALDVGDVVSITHPTPGWEAKPFRVQKLELEAADKIRVTLSEYDDSVYTFDVLTPPAIPDTNLPDPFSSPPPSGLTLESGTEHLQVTASGTVITRMLAQWAAAPSTFVDTYEVAYKLSAASGWTSFETSERQHYFTPVSDGHAYDVRVRAVYYNGRRSSWIEVSNYMVVGKTEPPAAPTSFSFASQRDYTREFSWTLNTADPDVAGYQIRFSTTLTDEWDAMTPMHLGLLVSSPWETNILNAGTYRFAIKTVDTTGNESATAKYITATLEESPASNILLARYPRLEGWPGTITNGYVLPNSNDIESTDSTTWDDLEVDAASWDAWLLWGIDGDDLTYQYSDIDLGLVLTFRPMLSAQADGAIVYEINHSQDNATWSGWITPTAEIDARYIKVRITVTGEAPRIQSMTILLSGQKITEDISDLDTSTLSATYRTVAGDIRLPIKTTFATIKSVQVALQNTGAGWSWELIDKQTTTGPRIKIYDNTGTLADATIDATIKGY
ncbi:hypothetical protein PDESU_06189 [Pontiella desulfatans]|uniref:Fibronectin type-III domain-containing protein n=1 Tax=Pontiella desulfatans TaxID=2750659 RepID=A0A6C2UDU6_PONDE|nr:phage tail protein [Pontiella desulfatans]VGO17591.1 hypothetical protein PDESU_06189 [Pontiella desulfatans]